MTVQSVLASLSFIQALISDVHDLLENFTNVLRYKIRKIKHLYNVEQ